ncbi:MAG: hypothetical protein JSV49_08660 [Thermoplasmata archaeon]|nr:MAG: hypothetical protein JSV49_08660 [Thermoplasmata archaeon]
MKIIFHILTVTFITLIIASPVSAHVPSFSDEHGGLDSAVDIKNPTKSWVIYDDLYNSEDVRYYRLELYKGERLRLVLFSPEQDNLLSMVIMGPGITSEGTVPEFIETLNGSNSQVVTGERPDSASYEPFTPGSYYYFVDYDEVINVSGTYFVAVYSSEGGGNFGLAVGYKETFSLIEWIRVPIDAVKIHMWEGQNPVIILSPLIITLIAGLVILVEIKPKGIHLPLKEKWRVIVSMAALMYIGTGFIMLHQMMRALTIGPAGGTVIVTIIFAVIPIFLGYLIFKITLNLKEQLTKVKKLKLFVYAILGLFLWSGLILGPILVAIVSFLPAKKIVT